MSYDEFKLCILEEIAADKSMEIANDLRPAARQRRSFLPRNQNYSSNASQSNTPGNSASGNDPYPNHFIPQGEFRALPPEIRRKFLSLPVGKRVPWYVNWKATVRGSNKTESENRQNTPRPTERQNPEQATENVESPTTSVPN